MKSKILAGCLIAMSVLTTSCSDFLTEDPKGRQTPDNYYNSQDALDAGIVALFQKVNQTQSQTNPMYPQWQGDDITANPGSNKQACAQLDAFSATNNNKGIADAWNLHYTVIKAANLIIKHANDAETTEEERGIAIGQAYFWRAYSYYYLVRVFGPLPVISDPDVVDTNIPLTSVEDIYKLIVGDLTKAKGLLPTGYTASPRHHDGVDAYVTKQAVQSTLAAVYMSMAGYPLNKGTEYYKLAAQEARDVIDHKDEYGFYLESEWKDVYSMGANYNKATVLGIDYSPVNGSWWNDSQLTSCNRFEGLGDGGWGDAWGEIKFWKNYPTGPRKDAVYAPKITFQDGATITKSVDWWELDENGKKIVDAYHPMFSIFSTNCSPSSSSTELAQAYDYTQPNYTGMTNGHRHRVIRYSEVLLWYAESAARSGAGDLALARQCLKTVRARACDDPDNVALPSLNGSKVAIDNMSADQLAEACYIEHGWEVAGYWVAMVTRRSDELRMNELKKNFDFRVANEAQDIADGITAKEGVLITNTTWGGDNSIYVPYPDTEVEKNPNLKR